MQSSRRRCSSKYATTANTRLRNWEHPANAAWNGLLSAVLQSQENLRQAAAPSILIVEGHMLMQDPRLVARMDAEVFELTGVGLEDLLNPSKVVNLELERLKLEAELADFGGDAEEREKLEAKLDETERKLYTEKRTVFAGWLKGLFIGQALIAVVLSGYMVYDAFPTVTLDISLQALGFWSYWLFVIPSLRARRPRVAPLHHRDAPRSTAARTRPSSA